MKLADIASTLSSIVDAYDLSKHFHSKDCYSFAYRLQIILVNRLVLNLAHTANGHENSELYTKTLLDPPVFATGSFLGNIGGPVRSFLDDMDLEDGAVGADGDSRDSSIDSEYMSSVEVRKGENGDVLKIAPTLTNV